MPSLSVVVPCYNIERYVDACMESLAGQTFGDFEAVFVDDGSSDATLERIVDFCARDPRFRYLSQQNQGAGRARNAGFRVATGEYLAFVDGDDFVHPDTYQRLVETLTETGSDFAICSVGRFNRLGVSSSYTHGRTIRGSRSRTHISVQPELVLDRMAWNKVYRRDFWDREGLVFPDPAFEDFPVSVAAHVRAGAVDVIDEVLYFWRERDGGEASVTGRGGEQVILEGRFVTSMMAFDTAVSGAPDSVPLLREHLLDIDVPAILGALSVSPAERAPEILRLAREMVEHVGGAEDPARRPFYRVQAAMLARGDVEGLIELNAWSQRHGRAAPLERSGFGRTRLVEKLPGLRRRAVPRASYEVEPGRVLMTASVVDAGWVDDLLEVRIVVDAPAFLTSGAGFVLWLESEDGLRVPCRIERVLPAPDAENLVELTTAVDPQLLKQMPSRGRGFWLFRLQLETRNAPEPCPLLGPSSGRERFTEQRSYGPVGQVVVRPFLSSGGFGLAVRNQVGTVTGCTPTPTGGLELNGTILRVTVEGTPRFGLIDRLGVSREFPVELTSLEVGWSFRAEVPCALLADHPDQRSPLSTRQSFEPWLDVGTTRLALTPDLDFRGTTMVVGHRSVTVCRSMSGTVQVTESRTAPEVTGITWVGDPEGRAVLEFSGIWRGRDALPDEVLVGHYGDPGGAIEQTVPLAHDEAGYSFRVDVDELVRLQTGRLDPDRELVPRVWHLLAHIKDLDMPQVFDRDAVPGFPAPRWVSGIRVAIVLARDDVVRIAVGG